MKKLFCLVTLAGALRAQTLPLGSVAVTGSKTPQTVVMEIAGLKSGAPIDKTGFEQACAKLGESGLFDNVSYSYRSELRTGYSLTLDLTERQRLMHATMDIPGVNDEQIWRWVIARHPAFDHKCPDSGTGQDYLAHEIETHLGSELHGHHVVAHIETDPGEPASVSYLLGAMPQISALRFNGASQVNEEELRSAMLRVVGTEGYVERHFKKEVEWNLRPIYEQHGFYRVKFPGVKMERVDENSVSVTTLVDEGPQYRLASVDFVGEGYDTKAMRDAAEFPIGKIADWQKIQVGINEALHELHNVGYLDADTQPARVFDDIQRMLSIRLPISLGPLYRIRNVSFKGLSSEQEQIARASWSAPTGAPLEARYLSEFQREFGRRADLRAYKKTSISFKRAKPDLVDVEYTYAAAN